MKYLLDVNVLLAAVWATHPQFAAADAWLNGKSAVVCPISELGFLRTSTNKKAIAAPTADARRAKFRPTLCSLKRSQRDGPQSYAQLNVVCQRSRCAWELLRADAETTPAAG